MTDDTEMTTFALWVKAMGLNLKQITKGGELIGISEASTRRLYSGKRAEGGAKDPTHTELMAMSAARANLPPWSPEADEEIAAAAAVRPFILAEADKLARARKRRG